MHPIIEVDQKKLIENLAKVQRIIQENVKIMAIIKSNAYGHGMLEIAKALSFQVDSFGVGFFHEALLLRQHGIIQEILVLGPSYDFELAIENKVTITIESTEQAMRLFQYIEAQVKGTKKKIQIHLKVDTGFGRFGLDKEGVASFLKHYMMYSDYIVLRGVYSHISMTKKTDATWVEQQNKCFLAFKEQIQAQIDTKNILFHLANSEIAIDYAQLQYDMIRIGNALFGPVGSERHIELKSIASIKLPVVSVHERGKGQRIGYGRRYRLKKDSKIGVVEAGFYEGIGIEKSPIGQSRMHQLRFFARRVIKAFLRKEYMLYQGKKLPIIGMVNMQYTMIDITGIDMKIGDFVEYKKSPLYFKENIERRHILEEDNGISNKS